MAFTPKHGKNGLIYVSGTELPGANAWTVNIQSDKADIPIFGDAGARKIKGLHNDGGSITAWHDQAAQILQTAALADVAVAFLIYPDRTTLDDYYSGNAFFNFSSEAGMDAAVGQTADFECGDGSKMGVTGFA